MKTLVALLALSVLMFAQSVRAQQIFGLGHQQTADTLQKTHYLFLKHLDLGDGLSMDEFESSDPDKSKFICYFNKKDVCFEFKEIMNASAVFNIIESLNRSLIRIDDYHWINKNASVKVTYDPPSNGTFFVSFRAMDITD